jgi:hypothetical protein
VWQGAVAAPLVGAKPQAGGAASAAPAPGGDAGAASVRLAYDDEFLYVAIACPQIAGVTYRSDEGRRTRDADLAAFDRVVVRLDADRDYATCFELAIDSRGWTADACWGLASWNPAWYVAAGEAPWASGVMWTVEAAIPWSELADGAPRAGDAWACAIDRVAPHAGAQTWAGQPGEASSPTRFGLVLFQ